MLPLSALAEPADVLHVITRTSSPALAPPSLQVAARLWQLLVVRAGLMQHLGAVKHYLLLARGDFWDVFLGEAGRLMAAPPRPATANADVAVPFQAAAGKTSAADDPYFRLFKIHFSDQPLKVGVVVLLASN
jgi:gamma-tubulin complex component 4